MEYLLIEYLYIQSYLRMIYVLNNNGNNGSETWGGKDGPPDIDEAKKFREQFSFFWKKIQFWW